MQLIDRVIAFYLLIQASNPRLEKSVLTLVSATSDEDRKQLENLGYDFQAGELDELLSLTQLGVENCGADNIRAVEQVAAKYEDKQALREFVSKKMKNFYDLCISKSMSFMLDTYGKHLSKLDRIKGYTGTYYGAPYMGSSAEKIALAMAKYLVFYCKDLDCKKEFHVHDKNVAVASYFNTEFLTLCRELKSGISSQQKLWHSSSAHKDLMIWDGASQICTDIFSPKIDRNEVYRLWQARIPEAKRSLFSLVLHRH